MNSVLIIIQQLKSLKFQSKENYFQTHACSWYCSFTLFSRERPENIKKIYIQHGKGFIEMQLTYLIDIFEDNYKIVRDCSETSSVNVMKNRPLAAKKQ